MPTRGDRYVIEIDGPYYAEKGADRGPFWKAFGLNAFFTENQLNQLRKKDVETTAKEELVCVGDEVLSEGCLWVVTCVDVFDGRDVYLHGVDKNGRTHVSERGKVIRTGRRHEFLTDAVRSLKSRNCL